jgi:hypothetical protein
MINFRISTYFFLKYLIKTMTFFDLLQKKLRLLNIADSFL